MRIHHGEFIGFGPTHNLASNLASNDWILSLDCDEELSKELAEELLSLKLDPAAVYEIRRHNFFNGKRIRGCGGWDPDFVVRLYNRKATAFDQAQVHEKVLTTGLKENYSKESNAAHALSANWGFFNQDAKLLYAICRAASK